MSFPFWRTGTDNCPWCVRSPWAVPAPRREVSLRVPVLSWIRQGDPLQGSRTLCVCPSVLCPAGSNPWVPWTALGRRWVPPPPRVLEVAPSLVPTVRHCLKPTDREGGLDHCPLVYFCQVFRCLGQRGNLGLVVPFDQNRKAFCMFLSGVWEPDFKI